MNVGLILFFYENEKEFALKILTNLLKNSIFIDIHKLISSFQFFDNFNETNPYFNLSFPNKPNEILDLHYKRIIIISNLVAKAFHLLNDFNFFDQIFKEIIKNFKENSSNLLILYGIYSEIIQIDQKYLNKLKECSVESLEIVLNLESYELCRSDIWELESQILNNLQTLKILMSNNTNNEYLSFLNEILKLPSHEKRKRLEDIYNKVLIFKIIFIYYYKSFWN